MRQQTQLELPGLKIVSRKSIEAELGREKKGWRGYLLAALTVPFDRAVTIDFKEIDREEPAKAAKSAHNSIATTVRRRNLRSHLRVSWKPSKLPHVISLIRTSKNVISQAQAERMVYGPIENHAE